jgi:DNA adenine methylase
MNGPLKWHGGKHYLAAKHRKLAPPHLTCVETHGGGASFTLASDGEGVSEVINDANGALMNFWRVLRSDGRFGEFQRLCEATPFSEQLWQESASKPQCHTLFEEETTCPMCAWRFFINCRMSMAGRMKNFTPLTKTRVRRGMNAEASAWLSAVDGLPEVHARLKRVVLLNQDAIAVIRKMDHPDTLFYCDPPYLHETRSSAGEYGQHEMDEAAHIRLLSCLRCAWGKVMLCGYYSELYCNMLLGQPGPFGCAWHCTMINVPNNAASGATKDTKREALWMNYQPQ